VDNSAASSGGSSTVIAVECNGTDNFLPSSFAFNSLKGSTLNVYSNGGGSKRGLLVSAATAVSARDMNIYVAAPVSSSSTGSYIGAETTDASGVCILQTTNIAGPSTAGSYTGSDIKQTAGSIEISPGTNLIHKTAGGMNFTINVTPTIIFYGVRGELSVGAATPSYISPGSSSAQQISQGGKVPAYPESYARHYHVQQTSMLIGMYVSLDIAPSSTYTTSITVYINNVATAFTVTYNGTDTGEKSYYGSSITLQRGDLVSVRIDYTGTTANTAAGLTVQLDVF
jgi:hypothetical protein